jgi:hypothetical protein
MIGEMKANQKVDSRFYQWANPEICKLVKMTVNLITKKPISPFHLVTDNKTCFVELAIAVFCASPEAVFAIGFLGLTA